MNENTLLFDHLESDEEPKFVQDAAVLVDVEYKLNPEQSKILIQRTLDRVNNIRQESNASEDTKLILSIISNVNNHINNRFDKIEARLNKIENNLELLNNKIDSIIHNPVKDVIGCQDALSFINY